MLNLKNYRVLIVGLGKSGIAASRLLTRSGAKVTAADNRQLEELSAEALALSSLGVEIEAGTHSMINFLSADLIILSPGVPGDISPLMKAREKGIKIIGELELACQYLDIPLIAITGSNGKSTTTTLIGEIIKTKGDNVFVGGNLGTPLSEYILSGIRSDCAVVEVSSFQLETIEKFSPYISILLNISPDHLDRYHDIKDYVNAKFRIFENQDTSDFTIINGDEQWYEDALKMARGKAIPFSRKKLIKNGVYIDNGKMISSIEGNSGEIINISEIRIKGIHNLENAMAASAAALVWGCSRDNIANTLREFSGLEHRLELVKVVNGVRYYDDSFSTTPETAIAAIEAFEAPEILILGGSSKNSDFGELGRVIRDSKNIKAIIGIGEEWQQIKSNIKNQISKIKTIEDCFNMQEIVQKAGEITEPGDVVLLS
ncbi:MAG: UDP-N-acetylmuramoylalanine--D-glutamate ligase, partial [Nitrospirae bacterium RIFCSPLOWO2_02_42_7]